MLRNLLVYWAKTWLPAILFVVSGYRLGRIDDLWLHRYCLWSFWLVFAAVAAFFTAIHLCTKELK